jgi:hypothetical protein
MKFETIPGREENTIFGLKLEKKEVIPDVVSFHDYLPNNITSSPYKKGFSHTSTTKKFNLRR